MIPSDYKSELSDTAFQEIKFTIEGDQFACELQDVDRHAWGWHVGENEAREYAQLMANEVMHRVEVAVYGFWGHYGREYVESFIVTPTK